MTTQPQSPSEQEIDRQAEQLAMLFHATYEKLAPNFGYKTREASAVPWLDVPKNNRELMLAVMRLEILPWHNEALAQAADKREQEARLNELNMLGKFWQTGIGKYAGETTQQWKQRVADYVIERSAILDRQARAAEGEQ